MNTNLEEYKKAFCMLCKNWKFQIRIGKKGLAFINLNYKKKKKSNLKVQHQTKSMHEM